MDTKTKFVTQYRAELTLDSETTCTINSTNQQAIQANIRNVLKVESLRIEPTDNGRTSLIYGGDEGWRAPGISCPVGWMAELEVPQSMSVRHVTETRFAAQKAV
jgi:hypothetical protein